MSDTLDLARKYRPVKLKDFYGNAKTKETVLNLLSKAETRPQLILLSGPSGCGKTTLARLIAKEYACTNRDNSEGACGTCPTCTSIEQYIKSGDTSIISNIQEVDIADKSGKHDIESVIEDMLIPTYNNEWKIYIFDEVHMSSVALQNRLLKITEEPPENVLIILCTTNPEKLLDTLKNRCRVHLEVNKPTVSELKSLLKAVCKNEGWEQTATGIDSIINYSDGVVRTSLYNLQRVGVEHNSITEDTVNSTFNVLPSHFYFDLLRALHTKNTFSYVTTLYNIKTIIPLDTFYTELKFFVRNGIYILNGINVDGFNSTQLKWYKDFFDMFSIEEVSTLMSKLLSLNPVNLELELLMFGYQGLTTPTVSATEPVSVGTEEMSEVEQEEQYNMALKREEQEKQIEQSLKTIAEYEPKPVSLDLINKTTTKI